MSISGKLTSFAKQLLKPTKNVRVIVLGHQKTGTTAIAALLAKIAALELSNDPLFRIDQGRGETVKKLMESPQILSKLCRRHPKLFGQTILKDPDLIYVFPSAKDCFQNAQFVFVVRDPRDTIRSICNRLGLVDANLKNPISISDMDRGNRHWELVLSGRLPETKHGAVEPSNIVANLAHRWNQAAEIYLRNSEEMKLIKYEEFVKAKESSIASIAKYLGLYCAVNISDSVDFQYQSKGDSLVNPIEFFGTENLAEIEVICAETMRKIGYKPMLNAR